MSITLVEPYCNVPLIQHTVIQGDEEGSGSGDEKSITEGVYGGGGISRDIKEHQIFRSKKELMTCLSIISTREKFQFKVFKSNTHFLIVRCVHNHCSWRVWANKLVDSDYWMVTKHENKHTCPMDFKTI